MPYVRRDSNGRLVSLHRQAEPGLAEEFLADDHGQVQAFVGNDAATDRFASLDAGFIRVLEDLIDVLVAKRVINVTDLPIEAQHKLYSRRDERQPTALSALNLLGDGAGPDGALPALSVPRL